MAPGAVTTTETNTATRSRLNLRKASGGGNFPRNVFVAFVVEVA